MMIEKIDEKNFFSTEIFLAKIKPNHTQTDTDADNYTVYLKIPICQSCDQFYSQ